MMNVNDLPSIESALKILQEIECSASVFRWLRAHPHVRMLRDNPAVPDASTMTSEERHELREILCRS